MNNENNEITADPEIIVSVIEGLLISLSITQPMMLDYISDYAAGLKTISNNLERILKDD